jgi:hypothetical protein
MLRLVLLAVFVLWLLPAELVHQLACCLAAVPLAFFWAGCPCCGLSCSGCLGGSAPEEFEVELAGFGAGNCTDCADLNGIYTLQRAPDLELFDCVWAITLDPDVCGIDEIQLHIREDMIIIDLWSGAADVIQYEWPNPDYPPDEVDCQNLSALDIPWDGDPYAPCQPDLTTAAVTTV